MGTVAEEKLYAVFDGERSISPPAKRSSAFLAVDGMAPVEAERPLWASDALYRASFEQAAVGNLHTSLEGRILECNECFAGIVGYTPSELVGSSFQVITPPEDRGKGNTALVQLLSGEVRMVSFEKRYLRKDRANLDELSVWADPADRSRMIEVLMREGACRNLETQFRKKNGETVWGLMSASLIELDGTKNHIGNMCLCRHVSLLLVVPTA